MTSSLLDRLLHRCHVANTRGNSYPMRRLANLSKAIHPTATAERVERIPAGPSN